MMLVTICATAVTRNLDLFVCDLRNLLVDKTRGTTVHACIVFCYCLLRRALIIHLYLSCKDNIQWSSIFMPIAHPLPFLCIFGRITVQGTTASGRMRQIDYNSFLSLVTGDSQSKQGSGWITCLL